VVRERGGHVDDEEATYIVTTRTLISWPFDEQGRPTGEDAYSSMDVDSIEPYPNKIGLNSIGPWSVVRRSPDGQLLFLVQSTSNIWSQERPDAAKVGGLCARRRHRSRH